MPTQPTQTLHSLLRGVAVLQTRGSLEIDVHRVCDNSRDVGAGDLFVAQKGQSVDGHQFLPQVIAAGARVVVVEDAREHAGDATVVIVRSTVTALAQIAANFYGRPADTTTLIGLTGTNGKTTTTFLTEALLTHAGKTSGIIGTVSYRFAGNTIAAPFTTPTPLQLHALFAQMKTAGCTHIAMECSSHALSLGRLHGVSFDVAAFTNLTQDHLDFHGTMENYRDAKALLFKEHTRGTAVILMDGEYGEFFASAAAGHPTLRVTAGDAPADIRVTRVAYSIAGIVAELATPVGAVSITSPLIGTYNVENLAVAVGIGVALGFSAATISAGLSSLVGVPGRVERVPNRAGVDVFVDYAHTPDALERVMAALRPLTAGRMIVVFGCGGDRDRGKRPQMGRAVAKAADLAIITSDNPRTEDPKSIIDMIVDGVTAESIHALPSDALKTASHAYAIEIDRRQAIAAATAAAVPGDVILIAGKGHEDYQIIGKTKHPFDDRIEAAKSLEKLAFIPPAAQS